MKDRRSLMGMTITVEVVDDSVTKKDIDELFKYFTYVDNTFSTYKETSEVSQLNVGKLKKNEWSEDMKLIFKLSEQTKKETNGYFDILYQGKYDPSGIVKGWSIFNASKLLEKKQFKNYYVDAGGDIQAKGKNTKGELWKVGLRNPFNPNEVVKAIWLEDQGVATSGIYIRGQHIYNPHLPGSTINDIVSLSVIGPNVFEADRMATAAYAMGKKGIEFVEKLRGFEGYMIDNEGIATYTSGFNNYVLKP